jgi:hypothetical protein
LIVEWAIVVGFEVVGSFKTLPPALMLLEQIEILLETGDADDWIPTARR